MAEGTELTAASDANADDILSDGATGLMYFEEYLPRYARCDTILHLMYFAKDDIAALDYKSFYPKYDVERGMDIKALDQMAAAVSKAVTTTQEELTKQGAQRTALPAVWKGQAGDAAFASLDAQIKRATDDHAEALAISTALTGAATTLRKIVREKAQAVKDYWHPDLPDIPDRTTGVGRKKIDIYLDEAEHYPTSKEGKEAIEWLTKHFMPHVEGRVSGFNDLCSKTEKSVQDTYDTLITALNKLDTTAYPMPAETQIPTGTPTSGTPSTGTPTSGTPSTGTPTSGTPSTGTPTSGTPSTGTPTSGTPSTGTPTSGTPSTGTPTSSTPSSSDTALSGLASTLATSLQTAASSLATAATTGVSTLTTAITEAIEDLSGDDKKEDDKKDDDKKEDDKKDESKKAATFELNGKKYSLEVGADGQPKLTETGADGNKHEYSVKLDANGNPTIVDNEKKEEKPAADQSAPGTSTGIPATGTPAPVKKPEEKPTAGEPAKVVNAPDTGAELAEAGPL